MDDQYLSVTQVAQLKGVSRNAVYKAIAEGRLSSIRIVGVAIRGADAEAWEPKSRTGRHKGGTLSETTKARISEAQRARWQNRKSESKDAGTENTNAS